MKVILKSEVDNLGLPGDVVDVADGYGRNFLLPRGLAIIATKGAMKEAEALTRSRKAREAQTVGDAEAAREVIESRTLRLAARVDERGHLYGSINAGDVQRVLKERGHDIERKRIELKGTIKQIGEYEIPVQVHPQVTATVTGRGRRRGGQGHPPRRPGGRGRRGGGRGRRRGRRRGDRDRRRGPRRAGARGREGVRAAAGRGAEGEADAEARDRRGACEQV
jgi:large subunit ribosomal protein L9